MSVRRRLSFGDEEVGRNDFTEVRATITAWHAEERAMERHGGAAGLKAYPVEVRDIDWDAIYGTRKERPYITRSSKNRHPYAK